jgi:hypothetical protein
MRLQEVTGLGNFGVDLAIAVAAGGHQQARRGLLAEPDQAGLAFRIADHGVDKNAVGVFVGHLDRRIAEPTRLKPLEQGLASVRSFLGGHDDSGRQQQWEHGAQRSCFH